jgi:hypothetical protein
MPHIHFSVGCFLMIAGELAGVIEIYEDSSRPSCDRGLIILASLTLIKNYFSQERVRDTILPRMRASLTRRAGIHLSR